jgi:hypothetical protein
MRWNGANRHNNLLSNEIDGKIDVFICNSGLFRHMAIASDVVCPLS